MKKSLRPQVGEWQPESVQSPVDSEGAPSAEQAQDMRLNVQSCARDYFTYEEWMALNAHLKLDIGLEASPQFVTDLDAEGRDAAVLLQRLSKLIPPVNQRSPPVMDKRWLPVRLHIAS